MIRRWTAAALVVLVQCGASTAPLLHVHPDDEAPHDHGGALHAHLGGPSASDAILDHDDAGRTIAAHVFVGVAVDPFDAPALAPRAGALVVPPEAAAGRTPHVSHGHDPPDTPRRPSRAPPALLS